MQNNKIMKKTIILAILLLIPVLNYAQVAINTDGSAPDASAILDVQSTTQGMLVPRMTASERDGILSPVNGLLVYVTDDNQFYYYDASNSEWLPFGKNDADWKVNGNDMYSMPSGKVGVGTTSPSNKFTVTGVGDIAGTTNASNGGILIEDVQDADSGYKLFLDANELQTVRDGAASDLYLNIFGGGLYINQKKFAFDGEADTNKGILYGGINGNKEPMLKFISDVNDPDGNLLVVSGGGLTVISGGEHASSAIENEVNNNGDYGCNTESVLILADEGREDDKAISMAVYLQSANWDDRKEAINIYGGGAVEIVHRYDAGPNSGDAISDLNIGPRTGKHLELDDNEIHGMDGENAAGLSLNYDGGTLTFFHNSSGTTGQVDINGGGTSYALNLPNSSTAKIGKARATSWATYSDSRLKTNVKNLDQSLQIIHQLRPVRYFQHDSKFVEQGEDKTGNTSLEILSTGTHNYGFIAQELYKVVPEAVYKPENEQLDLWSVDYQMIIPILTAAIKEQQKQIEELKKEIRKIKENK